MTVVVLILLAVWFLMSVANQIPGPWTALLGHFSTFSLLPSNAFFAPDPIDVDYHLVFRDVGENDEVGPWREVALDRDGPLRVFWSTAKRDHQAVLAAVSGVAGIQEFAAPLVDDLAALMQVSVPYLFLLHRVLAEPRRVGLRQRQFMVVETGGFGESRRVDLAILSPAHDVGSPHA